MKLLNLSLKKHGLVPLEIQRDEWARLALKQEGFGQFEGNRGVHQKTGRVRLVYRIAKPKQFDKEEFAEPVLAYLARGKIPDVCEVHVRDRNFKETEKPAERKRFMLEHAPARTTPRRYR